MTNSRLAYEAKNAFNAQKERRISYHQELRHLLRGDFKQDSMLIAFYSNFMASGSYELAVTAYLFLMEWLGGYENVSTEEDTCIYANEQYVRTEGFEKMSLFVDFDDWEGRV